MKTQIIKNFLTVVFAFALPFFVNANNPNTCSRLEYTVNMKMNVLENDEMMSIQDWMVDDQVWSIEQETVIIDELEIEESNLIVEDWMTSNEYFKFNYFENKNQIKIESWMTDNELWRF